MSQAKRPEELLTLLFDEIEPKKNEYAGDYRRRIETQLKTKTIQTYTNSMHATSFIMILYTQKHKYIRILVSIGGSGETRGEPPLDTQNMFLTRVENFVTSSEARKFVQKMV